MARIACSGLSGGAAGAAPVGGLSMHMLHPPAGSVATLAVLGDVPPRVVEADAGPLLRDAVIG